VQFFNNAVAVFKANTDILNAEINEKMLTTDKNIDAGRRGRSQWIMNDKLK